MYNANMIRQLKDFYLSLKYGQTKRPERLKLHGLVTVASMQLRHDEYQYKRASVVDISSSGISIESFAEFNAEEGIMMEFTLPEQRVSIAGTVMRRTKQPPTWIYGVKFDADMTDKDTIKKVIKYAKSEMKKVR